MRTWWRRWWHFEPDSLSGGLCRTSADIPCKSHFARHALCLFQNARRKRLGQRTSPGILTRWLRGVMRFPRKWRIPPDQKIDGRERGFSRSSMQTDVRRRDHSRLVYPKYRFWAGLPEVSFLGWSTRSIQPKARDREEWPCSNRRELLPHDPSHAEHDQG